MHYVLHLIIIIMIDNYTKKTCYYSHIIMLHIIIITIIIIIIIIFINIKGASHTE